VTGDELSELLAAGGLGAACGECAMYLGASPEIGAAVGLLVVVAGRPIARHIVRYLRKVADKWDKLLGPPPDEKP